jgi:hypothetical protein
MNLHGIASPYVGAVNPKIPVMALISSGSVTAADGNRSPSFSDAISLLGQVQPITTRDLAQLDGINLGGVRWKIYLDGEVDSIVRPEGKGGDLIIIPTGRHVGTWLVVQVMEQFPDWVCAAIVQQSTNIPVVGGLTTDLSNPANEVIVAAILTGV